MDREKTTLSLVFVHSCAALCIGDARNCCNSIFTLDFTLRFDCCECSCSCCHRCIHWAFNCHVRGRYCCTLKPNKTQFICYPQSLKCHMHNISFFLCARACDCIRQLFSFYYIALFSIFFCRCPQRALKNGTLSFNKNAPPLSMVGRWTLHSDLCSPFSGVAADLFMSFFCQIEYNHLLFAHRHNKQLAAHFPFVMWNTWGTMVEQHH